MTAVIYLTLYISVLSFIVACIVRAITYAKQPLHLRWELYPVPHEEPERVKHGGSYFETVDHWTKPSKFNIVSEMKFMIPEMLFLKGLWEFNRKLWYRSFPFHFGLYMLIGAIMALAASALLVILAPGVMEGVLGMVLPSISVVLGALGAVLAVLGAFGLLLRRLRDPDLQNYTAPGDIFNLVFFIVALGLLIVAIATQDASAPGPMAITVGLLTFDTAIQISGLMMVALVLSSLLVIYIPLTHMAHFIAKYFTYHSIRWDDTPMSRAGELGKKYAEYLSLKPDWAAPHIGADGEKTWADIATTNPTSGGEK